MHAFVVPSTADSLPNVSTPTSRDMATHAAYRAVLTLLLLVWLPAGLMPAWSQEMDPAAAADANADRQKNVDREEAEAPREFARSIGGFVSILKLLAILVIFLVWVYVADWINRDCVFAKMPHVAWNMIVVFPMLIVLFLALVIPVFLVGLVLIVFALMIPLIVYTVQRNAKVHSDDRVMTPAHVAAVLSGKKNKRSGGADIVTDKGPPVGLIPMGAEQDLLNKSNLLAAKLSPGFVVVREVLYDAIKRHADKIILDYTPEMVSVRLEIDGVWHDAGNRDRETADPMLVVLKKISNLQIDDRRSRQKGNFGTAYRGGKQTWNFGSQGTKTGERAVLQLRTENGKPRVLEDLGMRPKLVEELRGLLNMPSGMLLFSAIPGGGLSTTLAASLFAADRFIRHFVTFEEQSHSKIEIDNIEVNTYRKVDGQSAVEDLLRLVRTEPDAVVIPNLNDRQIIEVLCQQATRQGRLIMGTICAKEAVESLLCILALKVPVEQFAPAIRAVVNQRLIRKLCNACKEAYNPPLDLVQKLGLPTHRVDTFYREPQNRTEEDDICNKCGGIGYLGRTAIFEFLIVDDLIREALTKQPKIEVLRRVARQGGNRSLQEEGIVLVARGITSLSELQRVLKQ